MKVAAFQKLRFTAELWDYTTTTDPVNGRVDTYYKKEDIRFNLVPSGPGSITMFSTKQVRYNSQLRNVRDAKGNVIFKDPLTEQANIAYVGVSEPMFDVYGALIGFSHGLSQEA